MKALISILQDRDTFLKEIAEGVNLKRKLVELNVIGAVSFAVYGAIIGGQHSFLQALSSCIKLPILFLLTTAICMPTLFIFSSFFGSKRSLLQTFILLATGTAIIGVALVGFAPITLFFIVTTRSYQFFKLLNVAFFAVSGLLGVLFFNRMYVQLSEDSSPAIRSRRMFLRFWLLLFAFVGTQLAWTLRPFFGAPELRFEVVREIGGNFYTDVFRSLTAAPIALGHKQGASADKTRRVEQVIGQLDHERIQAQIGADAAALDRIYADDFIGVGPSGTVRTKAQVISDFTSGELKFQSITTDEVQVRVYGNTAVETGRSTMIGQDKGKAVPQDTRFTRLWVKQQKRWRLVANHYSSRITQH